MYIEASVVIDGALDSTETLRSHEALDIFVANTIAESPPGMHVQIFTIEHQHAEDIDCECVQYLTDHLPYYESRDQTTPLFDQDAV